MKQSSAKELEALRKTEAAGTSVMAARNALRKGERERARELIKEAFAANPGDIAAIELLGDIFLEEGETEQALKLFERALKAHPGHAPFEEKVGICKLDLAEMESDRLMKHTVLELGDQDRIFERSVNKAVGLSMVLPGAGQIYNEETEKGIAYMVSGLLSLSAWFFPIVNTIPKKSELRGAFTFIDALHALDGWGRILFYGGAVLWSGLYAASITGAAVSAKRYNAERRASLGL